MKVSWLGSVNDHHPEQWKIENGPQSILFYFQFSIVRLLCFLGFAQKTGAPGRIRTFSLLIRSQTLYPVGLRAHYKGPYLTKNAIFAARKKVFEGLKVAIRRVFEGHVCTSAPGVGVNHRVADRETRKVVPQGSVGFTAHRG
jgi:hypothetical protein